MERVVAKPTVKLILLRFAKDVQSLLLVGAVENGFEANLGLSGLWTRKNSPLAHSPGEKNS